jgi:hypothetical protein
MSRHHMLPPIIYTPQPRPRKIETRKSRHLRSAGQISDAADVDEADETNGLGSSAPLTGKPALQAQTPIEGSERKPPSTHGPLSEGTLRALLVVQEVNASQR